MHYNRGNVKPIYEIISNGAVRLGST